MGEISKRRERYLKCCNLLASRLQPGDDLLRLKLIARIKRIEQINVWHPAVNLPIVLAANRLYRLPDVVGMATTEV